MNVELLIQRLCQTIASNTHIMSLGRHSVHIKTVSRQHSPTAPLYSNESASVSRQITKEGTKRIKINLRVLSTHTCFHAHRIPYKPGENAAWFRLKPTPPQCRCLPQLQPFIRSNLPMGQDGTERKLGAGPHRPPSVPGSEWSNLQAHRFDVSPLPMVRSG